MVMDVSRDKRVTAMNQKEEGMFEIQAKAIIFAMGCRELSRGIKYSGISSGRIYSAGTAQRLVNMEGFLPGRRL